MKDFVKLQSNIHVGGGEDLKCVPNAEVDMYIEYIQKCGEAG